MQKRIIVFVTLAAVLVVCSIARTQSNDPWLGTWKQNLEKPTYSPAGSQTVVATVKIEQSGDGIKVTLDAMDAEGHSKHNETAGRFDGKDNSVKGAQIPNRTTAYRRIDDRTFEAIDKLDGKPTYSTKFVVSADGKTMTATRTGTNAQGQSINNVIVFDKQ